MKSNHIAPLFLAKHSFLLFIHHSPDGDAIASALGLYLSLKELGKRVDMVCADLIPTQFQFLPSVHCIKRDFVTNDYDVFVTLDCGDSKRTGFATRLKNLLGAKQRMLVNIDHHPKNDLHTLAHYNFTDYAAPSTSYLVYKIIATLPVTMNHKIATCLLTGLYTDTGGFKHPNTTSETFKFASLLLSYGARLKDITSNIAQPATVGRLRLWGVALSRVKKHSAFNLISTYITHEDIIQTATTEDDIAGIAALLSTIPAAITILVIQHANQTVQVRLRTKSKKINVARLAAYLGGGGQRKAAGFTLERAVIHSPKTEWLAIPELKTTSLLAR